MADNPYTTQPPTAFWRTAVAALHYSDMSDLWTPISLTRNDRVATAGSCFAQHIGHNLAARGAKFMDLEPAPPVFQSTAEARRFGYGVFSCRYGNIYTSRQLLQLFEECHGRRQPLDVVWKRGGRYFDALRPGVDPAGHDSPSTILRLRELHLAKVRELFATVNLFVFTMGLTEGWASRADHTIYPLAPGTIAGEFDPGAYVLRNLRHSEVLEDMTNFRNGLKEINPSARILLTVSPVPLTATATDNHVLVATTYSKSVLRGVAGELAEEFSNVSYFPSYEIISSHPGRAAFFNPDLRTVNPSGVDLVMKHFFSGRIASAFSTEGAATALDLMCDEETLEKLSSVV